jgi:hypothetical protein
MLVAQWRRWHSPSTAEVRLMMPTRPGTPGGVWHHETSSPLLRLRVARVVRTRRRTTGMANRAAGLAPDTASSSWGRRLDGCPLIVGAGTCRARRAARAPCGTAPHFDVRSVVMLRDVILQIARVLAVLSLAPLLQAVIVQWEERTQRCRGPGIFQPYRDLCLAGAAIVCDVAPFGPIRADVFESAQFLFQYVGEGRPSLSPATVLQASRHGKALRRAVARAGRAARRACLRRGQRRACARLRDRSGARMSGAPVGRCGSAVRMRRR